jgi:hypothetical protein
MANSNQINNLRSNAPAIVMSPLVRDAFVDRKWISAVLEPTKIANDFLTVASTEGSVDRKSGWENRMAALLLPSGRYEMKSKLHSVSK